MNANPDPENGSKPNKPGDPSKKVSLLLCNSFKPFPVEICSLLQSFSFPESTVDEIRRNGEIHVMPSDWANTNFYIEDFEQKNDQPVISTVILQVESFEGPLEQLMDDMLKVIERLKNRLNDITNCVLIAGQRICLNFNLSKYLVKFEGLVSILSIFAPCENLLPETLRMAFSSEKNFVQKYLDHMFIPLNASDCFPFFIEKAGSKLENIRWYLSSDYEFSFEEDYKKMVEKYCHYFYFDDENIDDPHTTRKEWQRHITEERDLDNDVTFNFTENRDLRAIIHRPGRLPLYLALPQITPTLQDSSEKLSLQKLIVRDSTLKFTDKFTFAHFQFKDLLELNLSFNNINDTLLGTQLPNLKRLLVTGLGIKGSLDFSGGSPKLDYLYLSNCEGKVIMEKPPTELVLADTFNHKKMENLLMMATNVTYKAPRISRMHFCTVPAHAASSTDLIVESHVIQLALFQKEKQFQDVCYRLCKSRDRESHLQLTSLSCESLNIEIISAVFPLLKTLHLRKCRVVLRGEFRVLEELTMIEGDFVGWTMEAPKLRVFRMEKMAGVENLRILSDSSPELERFTLIPQKRYYLGSPKMEPSCDYEKRVCEKLLLLQVHRQRLQPKLRALQLDLRHYNKGQLTELMEELNSSCQPRVPLNNVVQAGNSREEQMFLELQAQMLLELQAQMGIQERKMLELKEMEEHLKGIDIFVGKFETILNEFQTQKQNGLFGKVQSILFEKLKRLNLGLELSSEFLSAMPIHKVDHLSLILKRDQWFDLQDQTFLCTQATVTIVEEDRAYERRYQQEGAVYMPSMRNIQTLCVKKSPVVVELQGNMPNLKNLTVSENTKFHSSLSMPSLRCLQYEGNYSQKSIDQLGNDHAFYAKYHASPAYINFVNTRTVFTHQWPKMREVPAVVHDEEKNDNREPVKFKSIKVSSPVQYTPPPNPCAPSSSCSWM